MEYLSDYIAYLKTWAAVRNRVVWAFPMSWEDFRAECEREDESDGQEWSRHIAAMSHSSRYV